MIGFRIRRLPGVHSQTHRRAHSKILAPFPCVSPIFPALSESHSRVTPGGWKMTLHRVKRSLLVSAAIIGVPAVSSAQAFGLVEIGTCALGRAFAATGSPCKDASTIYWNPAATTQLSGFNISAGAAAIKV